MEVLGLNLQDLEDDLHWSPPPGTFDGEASPRTELHSRWGLLLELFIQRQPDIICLQECPYDLEISIDAYLKNYNKGCSLFVRRKRNCLVYSKFECSKAHISAEVRSELLLAQLCRDPSRKHFWVLVHRMESWLSDVERVQHLLSIQWLHGSEDRVVYVGTLRDNERRLMTSWGWHRDPQGLGTSATMQVPALEVWRNWLDRPHLELSEVPPPQTVKATPNPAGPSSSITTTLGVAVVDSDASTDHSVHMEVQPSPSQWETSSEGLTSEASFPASPRLVSPRKKKSRKGNRCLVL